MLRGDRISLRPIREADLDAFYSAHIDIRTRGAFFPLGVMSESKLRQEFALEGTARGAFFNGGRNQDVLIYSLLRDDPRPWHQGA